MNHKIIRYLYQGTSDEIVEIELLPTEPHSQISQEDIENYLSIALEVLEVIESSFPRYTIRKVKDNIGF